MNFQTIIEKFNELEYTLFIDEDTYVNSKTKFSFMCDYGHITESCWNNIQTGRRCKECFQIKRLTYNYVKQEFAKHNYTLISETYNKSSDKLVIKCPYEHITEISWNKFQTGRRCRLCKHKSEQRCREIFEDYFGMEFPSCWPGWLNGLELDGYCEELDIAFEYNGEQHYKYIPYFHNKGRTLEMQQLRDKQKAELCRANGVKLFVIPYTIEFKDLENYIFELTKNESRISKKCREAAKVAKQKEIYKFDSKSLELLIVYESIQIASEKENIAPSTMRRLSKNQTIKNGVIFSRSFELDHVSVLQGNSTSTVEAFGYSSLREAARELGVPASTLRYQLSKTI